MTDVNLRCKSSKDLCAALTRTVVNFPGQSSSEKGDK